MIFILYPWTLPRLFLRLFSSSFFLLNYGICTSATTEVSEMPYEISEYGWGEFDAVIRVVFRDPSEKSVEFFHPLKLFPSDTTELSKRPVVHEFYDEIVFQDPNERLLRLLKSTPHGTGFRLKASILAPYYKDFTGCESADLKKIEDARKKIREETIKKQARFEELEAEREILMREISARGGDNV